MISDWGERPISALIVRLDSGASVNSENRQIRADEMGVLKVSAVSYGHFDPMAHKAVVSPSEQQRLTVTPKADTVLVSRANTYELVGASVYVGKDYPGLFLSDKLWRITTNPDCTARWLNYVLATEDIRLRIVHRATGTSGSMKNISQQAFLAIRVQVPPINEQRKIAAILGTWDEAIALTERRIAAGQQRKQGLMQRLLTGDVRFPEFARELWKSVRLGEVFDERRETGYNDLPLLAITGDQGIIYRDELDKRDTSAADKSRYLRICPGDIGYNTMRMWQGRSAVSKLEGIVSPAYTICTPKASLDVDFIGYLFQFPETVHAFRRNSQGLVSDTWNLKFDAFAKIKVTIPSRQEQHRIAEVLTACDRELDLLARKRDALQRQKRGLMQRLLTGRVRVKGLDHGDAK